MANPLDHPDGCGCMVCKRHRERLAEDPSYRELDAEPTDPEPTEPAQEPAPEQQRETVVVEHHHHHHHDRAPKRPVKPGKPGKEGKRGKRGRDGRKRLGFLRTLVVGVILFALLKSFYPGLNVPVVPGIACTSPGTTVPAGLGMPSLPHLFYNPFSVDKKLKDVSEDTVAGLAKKFGIAVVGGALHVAGETLREAASHPPRPEDVRAGLRKDAELVGRVIGFGYGALTGKSLDELVDMNTPSADMVPPEPAAVTGSGAATAAAAARAAGFSGKALETAVAIALAESGARSVRSPANSNGTYDHGFWQINSVHSELLRRYDWRDPVDNARMAYEISSGGRDWTPWTTYNSGAYRAHLSEAGSSTVSVATGGCGTTGSSLAAASSVTTYAARYLGVPYVWGGTSTAGLDCSGFVQLVYKHFGYDLPRVSYQQATYGRPVASLAEAQPGDILAFGTPVHHVGLYVSPNKMIHAPHPGAAVRYESIYERPTAIRRVLPAGSSTATVSTEAQHGLRIGTFNILDAKHTGGAWRGRWAEAANLLGSRGVSVAALQEVGTSQRSAVSALPGWESFGDWDAVTAWRADSWQLVDSHYVTIPTYGRNTRRMPMVTLQSRFDGRVVTFFNVHNPNWRIPGARSGALGIELAAARRVPGALVWLGDTNDRSFESKVVPHGFVSARTRSRVDQIVGRGVAFANVERINTPASDHGLHIADLATESRL